LLMKVMGEAYELGKADKE
ncbi:ComZ family protein, partial [Bacillus mycoides]